MVTEFNNKNNSAQIRKLIEVLATDYATSRDANRRKGALIGLAATGLGLGKVKPLVIGFIRRQQSHLLLSRTRTSMSRAW